MELPLSALAPGECGYICQLVGSPNMNRRLEELGMVPGTRVCCELVSPAGDPAAYRARGALIALRRQDAQTVRITETAEEEV